MLRAASKMKMRDQVRITPCNSANAMMAIASRTTMPCATVGASVRRESIACLSSHGIASENAFVPTRQTHPRTSRPSSGRRVFPRVRLGVDSAGKITPEVFTISGRSSH